MKRYKFVPMDDITTLELAHCTNILIWAIGQELTNPSCGDLSIEKIHPGYSVQHAIDLMEEHGVERHFEIVETQGE